MRLNKYIASAGIWSRRKADEMINEGRVKVDGLEVLEYGFQVEEGSVVEVDGQVVTVSTKPPVYLMMNKPVGYITTVTDDRGRPTVMELVEHMDERLFPVGRLDYNTSGLLILTNDGAFCHRIIVATPSKPKVPKRTVSLARLTPPASSSVILYSRRICSSFPPGEP